MACAMASQALSSVAVVGQATAARALQAPSTSARPACMPAQAPGLFRCQAATDRKPAMTPADEDMSNVGLDDVFNLINAAEEADPSAESFGGKSTSKYTPFSSWYQKYWRAFPPKVDARSQLYGPNRPLYKGSFTKPSDVPEYLKGKYPGDYGCDFLSLCKDEKSYTRLRAQELLNARWAMLGIVGCLVPELFPASEGFEPVWFKAGAQLFTDAGIDYLGRPGLINAHSLVAVAATQVILMGGAEVARAKAKQTDSLDPLYPGGLGFDPLGFSSDPEAFAELKVKELKNGRLAMLAMAGLFAQGYVTGEGPLENLAKWLS